MSLELIFVAALVGVVLMLRATSLKTVERSQRLVIERFGRFRRCGGPGRHVLIPFIESGRLIELNDNVRGWQGMSAQEIEGRLLEKVYGSP